VPGVVVTREPGGSPGAEAIRALIVTGEAGRWDAETETLLLYAARRDHVRRTIEPALAAGQWVVCDRFADSTRAYQGVGRGVPLDAIDALHAFAVGVLAPDLTLMLDLPVETGLARATARAGNETRFEGMALDFHRRLRQGFLDIAAAEPGRCAVIDATPDAGTVQQHVRDTVRDRLAP
jgi:dTMP kinase